MVGEGSEVIHEGANWVLGRDAQGYGIWPKLPGLRLEGEPAARFAATADGLASASHLLGSWDSIPSPSPPVGTSTASKSRPRWWLPVLAGVAFLVIAGGTALIVAISHSGKTSPAANSVLPDQSQSSTTQSPVGTGYLSTSSIEAVFIQWNQSGDSVSGSAQVDYVQGAPPNETLSTNTINLTGKLSGDSISVSFNGGVQEFGTISGGSFTLNFPQVDGSLAPVTFASSDPSSFNSAVAKLHTQVQAANTNAAEAQRQAQQESAINSAISTVNADIAALNQVSFSSAERPLSGQLQKAEADLAKTDSDANTAAAEPGANNQCYDAGVAAYDAGTTSYDAGTVSYTASQVESAVTSVRRYGGAASDFQAMLTAESALPSYRPTSPSQADLNQASAAAGQAVTTALETTNAAIDQANGYVTSAFQAADTAYQGIADCGTPPTAPSPQQHIS